jgi:LCP family protein required for cell wall assembly
VSSTRPRSSAIAAFLSFLWPGLGHWYGRRTRAALLFAVPALLAVGALATEALGGLGRLAALLLTPQSALTILILVLLMGAWRLIAIVDSSRGPRMRRTRTSSAVVLSLGLIVVVTHAWAGYVAWKFYVADSQIFVADNGPDATSVPSSPAPGASEDPGGEYLATPLATPETVTERINILLTGIDTEATRQTELTDSLLVLSVDPVTSDVALVSFPRDISNFPLYDGRTFTGKINGLMHWAKTHPKEFPDGAFPSLIKELGFLLGAPIHYYAALDLAGFRKMIDAVDGVTIENKRQIADQRYDWMDGRRGFFLSPGKHKLNGEEALAYVRSRYTPGDNDFNRARRQQQVLLALRKKLTSAEMLPKIPELVEIAGDTITTNFPPDRIGEMVSIASNVEDDDVRQVVLTRPYAERVPASESGGVYKIRLVMSKLKELSVEIFGKGSAYYDEVMALESAAPGSSAPASSAP